MPAGLIDLNVKRSSLQFNNDEQIRRGFILRTVRGIKPNLRYYILFCWFRYALVLFSQLMIQESHLRLFGCWMQNMRKTSSFDFNTALLV